MTTPANFPKTGVLLLNMGGPDRLDSVAPFLYNLFSDPEIIRLPLSFLLQKPLAWLIVALRAGEARKNYAQMGGGSPQLPITRQQADALKTALNSRGWDFPVYIAMRYWHPMTDEALDQIAEDGIENLVAVTLYPHFSYTTTGSSLNELRRRLKKRRMDRITLSVVSGYCKASDYLDALAGCIREGLEQNPWTCPPEDVQILFSAHSLPQSHVRRTRDPYPILTERCARTVMERHFSRNKWDLAYQSKVGRMPWLGPYTEGVISYYAGQKLDNVLIVPISFVSDHVETLVEIDKLYIPEAHEQGITHCYRAPVMNTRPDFIETLVREIADKIRRQQEVRFGNRPAARQPGEVVR